MYTKIFVFKFFNILKYDFWAIGASTPVSQSGYPLSMDGLYIKGHTVTKIGPISMNLTYFWPLNICKRSMVDDLLTKSVWYKLILLSIVIFYPLLVRTNKRNQFMLKK
jgi:hypothetical protein